MIFLFTVLSIALSADAKTPPPDLENAALSECTRYCFISLRPGNLQNQCIKFCGTCTNTDPQNAFKQGLDAKCDKKALFCMQQAGATYAKTQTCDARSGCLKKHLVCIQPYDVPTEPAPSPSPEPAKIVVTSDDLNKAAETSCNKDCMAQPKAIEAKCMKHCQCRPITFDTGIVSTCDEQAQLCMQKVTSKDKPPRCLERQQCFDQHAACVKAK